jgi:hypothetical protein
MNVQNLLVFVNRTVSISGGHTDVHAIKVSLCIMTTDHARTLMSVNGSKTAFSVLVNVLTSQEVTAASVLQAIALELMVEHVKTLTNVWVGMFVQLPMQSASTPVAATVATLSPVHQTSSKIQNTRNIT